jgi:hypothetical protein
VIGRGECTSACLCRGGHRSIVALAQSLQLKGAFSLETAAKIVPRQRMIKWPRKSGRRGQTILRCMRPANVSTVSINRAQCRQTTQQAQHSSYRRIKSMPFTHQRDIKVIYFLAGRPAFTISSTQTRVAATSPRDSRSPSGCGRFPRSERRKYQRHRCFEVAPWPRRRPSADISADTNRTRSMAFAGRARWP